MAIEFTDYQARIVGCLLEKEVTTPDQYPLTLNALTTAANQKSNREPVYSLDEATVLDTVEQLVSKRLISSQEGMGSRVSKYQHRFCNTEFGSLKFSAQQKAVICVLLLRGPQTPGELRTRTNRLCEFTDVQEVDATLQKLAQDGYVVCLAREPGKRESRYAHLFGSELPEAGAIATEGHVATGGSNGADNAEARLQSLEKEVTELKQQITAMQELLDDLTS